MDEIKPSANPEVTDQVKPVEVPVNPEPKSEVVAESPNQNNSTGPKNIAWDQVLRDYCTSDSDGRYPSLSDLAKKYDVNESAVKDRSATENWVAKRTESILELDRLTLEKKANEINDANSRHLTKWRRIQNLGNRILNTFEDRLNKFDAAQKQLDEILAGTVTDEMKPNIEMLKKIRRPGLGDLAQITTTLKTAIEGERIVLGLPIIVSKSDVSTTDKINLPPETVAEIDRLFELNKNDKPTDPVANQ
jgi:predicted DNA-binding protein YlxM (UPF0122 family)